MNTTLFRIALAKAGLPAIAIARKIGVHHSTLSCWVRGYYLVPEHQRLKISKLLNLSVDQLFPEEKRIEGKIK